MRTRSGKVASLCAAVLLSVLTAGAGTAADATTTTSSTTTSTTTPETSTTTTSSTTTSSTTTSSTTSSSTTTTTAAPTTTSSTTTTTAAPETTAGSIDRAAGTGDGTSGVVRSERLDAPGAAEQSAERSGEPLQLTEPPPTPTTTTLPPIDALPPESGEGRRIVYSKSNQWVWMVEADGTVVKDHPVSGNRQWNLPKVGTYQVSSKSMHTCALQNPSICWRYMVRFARGPSATWRDNIGFHEIPIDTRHGGPVQNEAQLGTALSGGCVRQTTHDAVFLWNWAPIGTRVVVLG